MKVENIRPEGPENIINTRKLSKASVLALLILSGVLMLCFLSAGCAGKKEKDIPVPTGPVTVTVADFPVFFNQVQIENEYRTYPVFVYEDTVYFPMTYYDCRIMGLETIWTQRDGFRVARSAVNWDIGDKYQAEEKNDRVAEAEAAKFPVIVNGTSADINQVKAPLLFFRGVLYFPLTESYMKENFGWQYTFDKEKGLRLFTETSGTGADEVNLPIAEFETGGKGAFLTAQGSFYYLGEDGILYQAPQSDPQNRQARYDLVAEGEAALVTAALSLEEEKVILTYRTTDQPLGSEKRIWLKSDGTYACLNRFDYDCTKEFDSAVAVVDLRLPLRSGNLYLEEAQTGALKPAGSSRYLYGWACQQEPGGAVSGTRSDSLYLIGDELYLLACPVSGGSFEESGICRVNIKTNQTERVCQAGAVDFLIEDEFIFFRDQMGYLYRMPVDGGKEEKLTEDSISDFVALNGHVYYINKDKGNQLYAVGKDEPYNPEGAVKSLTVCGGYVAAVFDEKGRGEYKLMIFDREGNVVYRTIEEVLMAGIDGGKIVFLKK